MTAPLPEYENPPVLEVVAGVQFETLALMQTRHFGEFWDSIKEEFPISQDAPPLPSSGGPFTIEVLELPPLRRMMLISADNHYVVQVQDSRFHVNWRKTKSTDAYPRYSTIFEKFQRLWKEFLAFVASSGLPSIKPRMYELTYVNHIDASGQGFATQVANLVKMYRWEEVKPAFLPQPSSLAAMWQFGLPESQGNLNANLSHARREQESIVVLNMGCLGPATAANGLAGWFDTAHEWIVRGFTDLTTAEAHRKWGRRQ
jgi:uncharacterized protein (TIGR04255 family)